MVTDFFSTFRSPLGGGFGWYDIAYWLAFIAFHFLKRCPAICSILLTLNASTDTSASNYSWRTSNLLNALLFSVWCSFGLSPPPHPPSPLPPAPRVCSSSSLLPSITSRIPRHRRDVSGAGSLPGTQPAIVHACVLNPKAAIRACVTGRGRRDDIWW